MFLSSNSTVSTENRKADTVGCWCGFPRGISMPLSNARGNATPTLLTLSTMAQSLNQAIAPRGVDSRTLTSKASRILCVFSLNTASSRTRSSLRPRTSAYSKGQISATAFFLKKHACRRSTKSPISPIELGCMIAWILYTLTLRNFCAVRRSTSALQSI